MPRPPLGGVSSRSPQRKDCACRPARGARSWVDQYQPVCSRLHCLSCVRLRAQPASPAWIVARVYIRWLNVIVIVAALSGRPDRQSRNWAAGCHGYGGRMKCNGAMWPNGHDSRALQFVIKPLGCGEIALQKRIARLAAQYQLSPRDQFQVGFAAAALRRGHALGRTYRAALHQASSR